MNTAFQTIILRLLRLYQFAISPMLGPNCRFQPSCSQYAMEAVQIHGALKGTWLTLTRLLRCHPWHAGGVDPVPPKAKRPLGTIRKNPRGDIPEIHESAFVDPTAIICGRVVVHEKVFIGPYAVIRADEVDADGHMEPITIGAHSNIQDGVVIHSKSGAAVTIGAYTSIAHRAIVHGPCTVGGRVFIGFNSVLFNCTVGDGCVVRHNAVVDGCNLPPGFYVPSTERLGAQTDLALIAKVSAKASEFSEDVARTNNELVEGYKRLEREC